MKKAVIRIGYVSHIDGEEEEFVKELEYMSKSEVYAFVFGAIKALTESGDCVIALDVDWD